MHIALPADVLCVPLAGGGPIDEIILLDREVDAVTPMCTQLTYEGLVDETMQIKYGAVTIDNPSGTHLPSLCAQCLCWRACRKIPDLADEDTWT